LAIAGRIDMALKVGDKCFCQYHGKVVQIVGFEDYVCGYPDPEPMVIPIALAKTILNEDQTIPNPNRVPVKRYAIELLRVATMAEVKADLARQLEAYQTVLES